MWPDSKGPVLEEKNARPSVSAVVPVEDCPVVLGRDHPPAVGTLNVTKSSRVHIGTKNVNITQNDVVKGRLLCLEIVSPDKPRRLRCCVVVFVCWAMVVVLGLAFWFCYIFLNNQTRLNIDLNETWYLRRGDWQALPPYSVQFLKLPVKYVVIGHSATEYCNEKYDCISKVRLIQRDHFNRYFDDIGPNFLVAGKGLIFEGAGANVLGAMMQYWNSKIVSIMFIGDYCVNTSDEPDDEQFKHIEVLLTVLVKHGIIQPDYEVFGYCQLITQNRSPGKKVLDRLNKFSHWNPKNITQCLA